MIKGFFNKLFRNPRLKCQECGKEIDKRRDAYHAEYIDRNPSKPLIYWHWPQCREKWKERVKEEYLIGVHRRIQPAYS